MRKVTLILKSKLVMTIDEGQEIADIMDDIDITVKTDDRATVEDYDFLGYNIIDSK